MPPRNARRARPLPVAPAACTAGDRTLAPYDAYLARSYVPGAVFFDAQVDPATVVAALKDTVRTLCPLAAHLVFTGDTVHVSHHDGRGRHRALPVERGRLDLRLDAVGRDLAPFLPRSMGLAAFYLGLRRTMPTIGFRVTALQDGLCLAYYFNHGCFDQASIHRVLELAATHHAGDTPEEVPAWLDLSARRRDASTLRFGNKSEHRAHGEERYGIERVERPRLRYLRKRLGPQNRLVDLRFDRARLAAVAGPAGPSANVLVIATALRLLARHRVRIGDPSPIGFDYPLNTRRKLGVSASALGNIFTHVHAHGIDPAAVADRSLAETAALVEARAPRVTATAHCDFVHWFDGLSPAEAARSFPRYAFGDTCTRIANYDSFDYSAMRFGGREPVMVLSWDAVDLHMTFSSLLTFDRRFDADLRLCIALPASSIADARQQGATSGLFTLID